jgi:hypothetical protein
MKLYTVIASACFFLACASQSAEGAGRQPGAASPEAQPATESRPAPEAPAGLVTCQQDLDCTGNSQCVEGYCRKY